MLGVRQLGVGLLSGKWQLCSLDEVLEEDWMLVTMYEDPQSIHQTVSSCPLYVVNSSAKVKK